MRSMHRGTWLTVVATAAWVSLALAKVGEPAAEFSGTDTKGKQHTLADYEGKWVVLEWHNQGCPYVKKHYGTGNMQKLQKEWTKRGVVWLTVISSAEGKQGYVTAEQADAYVKEQKAAPTAVLLDPTGAIGHTYGAKTTPHMFVIDPEGRLVYDGAIDDKPTTDPADVEAAKSYLEAALTAGMAGEKIAEPATKPYGCSVKYAAAQPQ